MPVALERAKPRQARSSPIPFFASDWRNPELNSCSCAFLYSPFKKFELSHGAGPSISGSRQFMRLCRGTSQHFLADAAPSCWERAGASLGPW